jgi:hypothetical protein
MSGRIFIGRDHPSPRWAIASVLVASEPRGLEFSGLIQRTL